MWDNDAGDNLWSNPVNWDGDVLPTSSDVATFNSTDISDVTVDINVDVAGVKIDSGYSGTVTQSSGVTIIARGSGFVQNDGSFVGGDSLINITSNGSFTLNGGSFTSTSNVLSIERSFTHDGGTFNHNSGSVRFVGDYRDDGIISCSSTNFNIVEFRKSESGGATSISNGCSVNLGDDPISGGGILNHGNLTVGTGHWDATYQGDTSLLTFSGGVTTINSTSVSGLRRLEADGGSITADNISILSMNATSKGNDVFIIENLGYISLASLTDLKVYNGDIRLLNGELNAPLLTDITFELDFDNSGSLLPDGVNIRAEANSWDEDGTLTCGNVVLGTFTLIREQRDAALTISNDCIGDAAVNLGNNPYSGGTVVNYGEFIVGTGSWNATYGHDLQLISKSGSSVVINSDSITGMRRLIVQGGDVNVDNIVNLTINNNFKNEGFEVSDYGSISLASLETLHVERGHIVLESGSMTAPNLTEISFEMLFDNSGNILPDGVQMTVTGDTWDEDGHIYCGDAEYSSIVFDATDSSAGAVFSSDCTVTGDLVRNNLELGNPSSPQSISIGGDLIINGSYSHNTSNLTYVLNGSGDQTISQGVGTIGSPIVIDKSFGTAILSSGVDTTGECTLQNGVLDISSYDMVCGNLDITDGKTLRLSGNQSATIPSLGDNTTVVYTGDGDGLIDTLSVFDWPYRNLTVNATDGNTEVFNFPADLIVAQNFSCLSGNCVAPSGTFTVNGDWNVTGDYDHNSGSVVLSGTNQNIFGSTVFNNFSKTITTEDTLTFPGSAVQEQIFQGIMELTGVSGELLRLRSSIDGTHFYIDPRSTRNVSYLDVKDSYNSNLTPINVDGYNITDSGNNINWGFNEDPEVSNLGPTAYVNDGFVTDETPTLTFTVSDPNGGDNVAYQIQIDDSSDFSTPVVDYESQLDAQGARSFTVGQSVASGTYNTGSEGQQLGDGSYYFRIRGIDSEGSEGSYAVANSGDVAFNLDFSNPGIPEDLDSTTHEIAVWNYDNIITATWSTPAEDVSGVAGYSYVFDEVSNTVPDATLDIGDVNQVSSNSLDTGGNYYFHIRAVDGQGNWGGSAHLGPFQIDRDQPGTVSNFRFDSGYEQPWVGSTEIVVKWDSAEDSDSGISGYSYGFDSISDTEADEVSDIGDVNQVEKSDLGVDNNYYLHIRAVDDVGNWGSTKHFGPFSLDSAAPSVPGVPDVVTSEEDLQPILAWLESTDEDSGVDHYKLEVSKDEEFSSGVHTSMIEDSTYEFTSELSTGKWFARVKAYDSVSNYSDYSEIGVFELSDIEVVVPDDGDDDENENLVIYVGDEVSDGDESEEKNKSGDADESEKTKEDSQRGKKTVFVVTVRDSSGEAMPNMDIKIVKDDGSEFSAKTDENGVVSFNGLEAGSYEIVYEKNGEQYTQKVDLEESKDEKDFTSLEVKFDDIVGSEKSKSRKTVVIIVASIIILSGISIFLLKGKFSDKKV